MKVFLFDFTVSYGCFIDSILLPCFLANTVLASAYASVLKTLSTSAFRMACWIESGKVVMRISASFVEIGVLKYGLLNMMALTPSG